LSKKINKTISDIFKEFNNLKINYAVLRNFENLKKLRSDIDILYDGNIKNINKIFTKIAKVNNWSYLIFDQNKSKNISRESKIYIFYFFETKSLEFLQIDFFKSLKIFTTPYYNYQISKKIEIIKNGIKIIPKNISYTYHIFQIANLNLKNKNNFYKIEKYRNKFLSINKNKIFLKNVIFENKILSKVNFYLKRRNYIKLKKIIFFYKLLIFISYYINNPLKLLNPIKRIFDYVILFIYQPWATTIKINITSKKDMNDLIIFLNNLKKNNIINDWQFSNNLKFYQKIFFSERRNLIVKKFKKKNIIKKNFKIKIINSFLFNKEIIFNNIKNK